VLVPYEEPMGGDRQARLRTAAEREALGAGTHYADVHDLATPPERAYVEALADARSVILRRFVRGVIRGSPGSLPDPVVLTRVAPDLPDAAPFSRLDGERLVQRTGRASAADAVAVLPFPAAGSVVVAPIVAIHGYDRLRLGEPVFRVTPDRHDRIDHPVDLVPLLRTAGAFADAEQAELIEGELAESVANLALARLARTVHRRRCRAADSLLGSLVDGDGDAPVPATDPAASLERVVTDGHPFHFAGKIRRGMSPADGLAYAPEFTGSLDLRFVAVHDDRARQLSTGGRSLADRLLATFDGLEAAVTEELPPGRTVEEYAVIPVHPWQYYREIPGRYDPAIADGIVLPIEGYTRPATPLLNLRTVVPATGDPPRSEPPPHCKLAIGVRTTNVERTVSPQAVTNGPRVTAVLRSIVDELPGDSLGVLGERAGACYYPPGGPHVEGQPYDDVRHLSGLLRQNPYAHRLVPDGAHPVPASSLAAESPATGEPVVREAVERYADATDTTELADAALGFLDQYVDAVVPGQLRLLSAYGIALESHLQNSLVVLEDGRPVATLVRDLGGIRVHHARLADRGFAVDVYPDSDIDADGERDLYRKLHYALFQNHLTELLVALVRSTPVGSTACWELIRDRCRETVAALRADGVIPTDRVDRDEAALFEEPAVHKALTAMRLDGKRHEYVTTTVSNPLGSPGAIDAPGDLGSSESPHDRVP
jgi:siderophore synthetase component